MNKCVWTEDDDGAWDTSCDNRFEFTADGPEENDFAFCPYCGKNLTPERVAEMAELMGADG